MKTKQIPAIITLVAGLITCIVSFIYQIKMIEFLKTLFLVIIVFFILGTVIKFVLDKNFPLEENEEEEMQEKTEKDNEEEEQKE